MSLNAYPPKLEIDGLPTVAHSQLDVTVTEAACPSMNLAGRKTISIKAIPENAENIYVGLTGVTTLTGFPLAAGDSMEIDCDDGVLLFIITGSGTQRVATWEVA